MDRMCSTPTRRSSTTSALAEAYAIVGLPAPVYADPALTAGVTTVKAAQIAELRAAVAAIW